LKRPSTSILFIYGLIITLLAFIYRDPYSLLLISIPNAAIGFALGFKRARLIVILLLISVWGTFLNAVLVANHGPIVCVWGPLVIRQGAFQALVQIELRLLAIAGAALVFIGTARPEEILRDLEAELRLPKSITFSLAYALRLIPLMKRDYEEIMLCRSERGYHRIAYLPKDVKTLLLPLLSIAYQRAIWAGITVELRGFRKRKPRYRLPRIGVPEIIVLIWLAVQVILPFAVGWAQI